MNSRVSRAVLATVFAFILVLCLILNTPKYPAWLREEYHDAFQGISKTFSHHDDSLGKVEQFESPAPPSSTSSSTPPNPTQTCSLTTLSMLYGNYIFPQMQAALQTHRNHSQRWNCTFTTLTQDLSPTHRLYSKQYYLLSHLLTELSKPPSSRQSWLLWVDADSILLNPAISPEAFLPPPALNLHDIYALVTADHNGLNAGIFYLKVHPKSVELMTRTVAFPLEYPGIDLGWFGEQAAMARVIEGVEKNATTMVEGEGGGYPGIVWVPREWFNLYHTDDDGFQGEEGDFLVHFAGLGATRLGHMQDWLDELEGHQGRWEVRWEETRLYGEVARFWAQFVANYTTGLDEFDHGRWRDP